MTARRLPLTVIGGFLGAGKTTLLNHWLRHAAGQRLAVLVNDFGALNIDAGLVEHGPGDTTEVIALTNGCVCCQIGDDMSTALIRVLDTSERFDAVVIEASGVADPWRIAQLGRADPGLSLDGVVVLVDASAAMDQANDPLLADTLERQLRAADLVVLNKCDLLAPDLLAELKRWVAPAAGSVEIVETTQGAVAPELLSGAAIQRHAVRHDLAARIGDPQHGATFETWSCRPTRCFDESELRAWLREPPSGLLRLKGWLRSEAREGTTPVSAPTTDRAAELSTQHPVDPGWSEIQFSGRSGTLRKASAPASGAALVAVSLRGRLPRSSLSQFFAAPL